MTVNKNLLHVASLETASCMNPPVPRCGKNAHFLFPAENSRHAGEDLSIFLPIRINKHAARKSPVFWVGIARGKSWFIRVERVPSCGRRKRFLAEWVSSLAERLVWGKTFSQACAVEFGLCAKGKRWTVVSVCKLSVSRRLLCAVTPPAPFIAQRGVSCAASLIHTHACAPPAVTY